MLSVTACATFQEATPKDYAGPTARIVDTMAFDHQQITLLFVVSEINGREILSSINTTRVSSHGQGMIVKPTVIGRAVPAQRLKLKLEGTQYLAMPIVVMGAKAMGLFLEFEGVIEFVPEENKTYLVKGDLKKGASSLWIEDEATGKVVGEKLIQK